MAQKNVEEVMKTAIMILLLVIPQLAQASDLGVNDPIGKSRTDLLTAQSEAYRERNQAARMWREKMMDVESAGAPFSPLPLPSGASADIYMAQNL